MFNIRPEHYFLVNGYSNLFWGWGGEDDDMGYRCARIPPIINTIINDDNVLFKNGVGGQIGTGGIADHSTARTSGPVHDGQARQAETARARHTAKAGAHQPKAVPFRRA